MSDNFYKNKYLKYKLKYNNLLKGGVDDIVNFNCTSYETLTHDTFTDIFMKIKENEPIFLKLFENIIGKDDEGNFCFLLDKAVYIDEVYDDWRYKNLNNPYRDPRISESQLRYHIKKIYTFQNDFLNKFTITLKYDPRISSILYTKGKLPLKSIYKYDFILEPSKNIKFSFPNSEFSFQLNENKDYHMNTYNDYIVFKFYSKI